ncbi:MAG: hypothetical protein HUU46_12875 [Candidatus Hydrogenedentes bacterium]|nr:hypothetical protein [Candidatus Hydrogenedentota bacterium]
MSVRSRIASLALLAAVALPLVVGCQFLVFKVCVKNNTEYYLEEFASKVAGAATYPDGAIKNLAPGSSDFDGGYGAGSYDFRASFDVSDDSICEDVVEVLGVEIENTNLCITYEVQDIVGKGGECSEEIYATLDYVL